MNNTTKPTTDDERGSPLWHWLAIGILVICWIAEASMCAERGF
jgi:hypothetical protein